MPRARGFAFAGHMGETLHFGQLRETLQNQVFIVPGRQCPVFVPQAFCKTGCEFAAGLPDPSGEWLTRLEYPVYAGNRGHGLPFSNCGCQCYCRVSVMQHSGQLHRIGINGVAAAILVQIPFCRQPQPKQLSRHASVTALYISRDIQSDDA